jgi:hypothetical protein
MSDLQQKILVRFGVFLVGAALLFASVRANANSEKDEEYYNSLALVELAAVAQFTYQKSELNGDLEKAAARIIKAACDQGLVEAARVVGEDVEVAQSLCDS